MPKLHGTFGLGPTSTTAPLDTAKSPIAGARSASHAPADNGLPSHTGLPRNAGAPAAPRNLNAIQAGLARKTLDAFKSNVAGKAYRHMTDTGAMWKDHALTQGKASVVELSNRNVQRLERELQPLSEAEESFVQRLIGCQLFATHATDAQVVQDGRATLFSSRKLEAKQIDFRRGHAAVMALDGAKVEDDTDRFGHGDFVFFALEAGSLPKKANSRFGNTVHRFEFAQDSFKEAWMSLGDMGNLHHTPDLRQYVRVAKEDSDRLKKRALGTLDHVFHGSQMRQGLALAIVRDCRTLSSPEDRARVLGSSSERQINNVINGFFRPEIKVPRQFSSDVKALSARSVMEEIDDLKHDPAEAGKRLEGLALHLKHLPPSERATVFGQILDATSDVKRAESSKVLGKLAGSIKYLDMDDRMAALEKVLQIPRNDFEFLSDAIEHANSHDRSYFREQFGDSYASAFSLAAKVQPDHLMIDLQSELQTYESGSGRAACVKALFEACDEGARRSVEEFVQEDHASVVEALRDEYARNRAGR